MYSHNCSTDAMETEILFLKSAAWKADTGGYIRKSDLAVDNITVAQVLRI